MSIDEAISKYKEITNTDAVCPGHCNIPCEKCVQERKSIGVKVPGATRAVKLQEPKREARLSLLSQRLWLILGDK